MIEVKNLVKRYGELEAVSGLSFTVDDGQIYGFLGPNGAGKTTTMNVMCGYIGADEGTVTINGVDMLDSPLEAKKQIGYLPEQPPLYPEMTAEEYLFFAASIKGIAKADRQAAVEDAIATAGLEEVRDRLLRNLSKGFKQRAGLAQAILGLPPVIILDEPTAGLDPKQIIEMRGLIRSLGRRHTVILSSHILSEVNAVCDKVMIISKGKLVACDTPEKLEEMLRGGGSLEVEVIGAKADVARALKGLGDCRVTYAERRTPGTVRFCIVPSDGKDIREKLFWVFAEHKLPVIGLSQSRATLEEVFLDLTSDSETEAE